MNNKNRNYTLFFILFTFLIFGYILIKTSGMRMAEDEAFSVLDILYMNFPYFFGNTANTHLLNSFFLWVELKCFGFDQTVLRLHSAFSYLIFAFAVYRISCWIREYSLRYVFLVLITLHPFMIEYFSLARGYGMSIAFMMMSLYLLYEFVILENGATKKKKYWISFWAGLSVLSCFVLLTFYISVLSTLFFFLYFMDSKERSWKSIVDKIRGDLRFWLLNAAFLLMVMAVVLKLNPASLDAYWPSIGFWSDTIYSITEMFFIGTNSLTGWVFIVLVLLLAASLTGALIRFYRSGKYEAASLFSLLFVTMYVLFMIQYYLFNINYVSYRAAIYLYPFIILLIFWSVTQRNPAGWIRKAGVSVLFVAALFVLGNFIYTFSFSRGIDTASKEPFVKALNDLDEIRPKGKVVRLGISRAFPATMHYYKLSRRDDWIRNIGYGYENESRAVTFYKDTFLASKYDYFIIEEAELEAVSAFQKVVIIKRYPGSPVLLLKSI